VTIEHDLCALSKGYVRCNAQNTMQYSLG